MSIQVDNISNLPKDQHQWDCERKHAAELRILLELPATKHMKLCCNKKSDVSIKA